jgi:type II secretory pathway component PulK
MKWVWYELTRPRGKSSHRFYRGGRRSRSGVALLLTLANLLLMSVLVSEMTYTASVRVKLAVHERDEAKAEQLAYTGAQIYEILLAYMDQAGRMIGPYADMMGIDPNNLWQALPTMNTGMMRMVFVSGGSIDDEDMERVSSEGLSEEEVAESREGGSERERNFLDFDGDFVAELTDEDSKVDVSAMASTNPQNLSELMANPQAQQLFGLMAGEDNDRFFIDKSLERWELIGNLVDWVDADDNRVWQGGSEQNLYANLASPYRPKNATFDSFEEIRLIDGWHDDDVWERFGKHLTIYGGGRINVNSAQPEVIRGVLTAYCMPNGIPNQGLLDQVMAGLEERRLLIGPFRSPADFISAADQAGATCSGNTGTQTAGNIRQAIKVKSDKFRVTSTGIVGDAKVTITTIIDTSRRGRGRGGQNRQSNVVHFSIE